MTNKLKAVSIHEANSNAMSGCANVPPPYFPLLLNDPPKMVHRSTENDVIVSPLVIPYDEFEKYKQSLPYYRNIAEEGRRIG